MGIYSELRERNYKVNKVVLAVAFLYSLFLILSGKIHFDRQKGVGCDLNTNYFDNFSWLDLISFIAAFIIFYIVINLCYKWLSRLKINKRCTDIQLKKPVIIMILYMAWSPWLLSFAPGSVLGDSFSSIKQILSGKYSNHHPVGYTLFVRLLMLIGKIFGGINCQVFFYTMLQFILFGACVGYIVAWIGKKANIYAALISLFYFCITPYFPSYSIIMWKDPIFSIALALYSILLFENSEKDFRWLMILSPVIIFFRNNGLFVLLSLSLIMLFMYGKNRRRYLVFTFVLCLFSIIIQGPVYDHFNVKKDSIVESVGVPLQQVAYVITFHQEELADDDIALLDNIFPIDEWKNSYWPCLVDSIKWNKQFDEKYLNDNIGEFFKIYVKWMPGYFDDYVKAYCMETLGFWHPWMQCDYGYIDIYIAENKLGVHNIDLIKKLAGFSIGEHLKNYKFYIGSGTLLWILIFTAGLNLYNNKKDNILIYLPSVLLWITIMLATPVAFSLRYVYVMAILLPVYIITPFVS